MSVKRKVSVCAVTSEAPPQTGADQPRLARSPAPSGFYLRVRQPEQLSADTPYRGHDIAGYARLEHYVTGFPAFLDQALRHPYDALRVGAYEDLVGTRCDLVRIHGKTQRHQAVVWRLLNVTCVWHGSGSVSARAMASD